jgi:hypothetical protein
MEDDFVPETAYSTKRDDVDKGKIRQDLFLEFCWKSRHSQGYGDGKVLRRMATDSGRFIV